MLAYVRHCTYLDVPKVRIVLYERFRRTGKKDILLGKDLTQAKPIWRPNLRPQLTLLLTKMCAP